MNRGTILTWPSNIVDKSSVVAVHKIIQDSMPPIAGVANGAMVLRDTMLEDMTIEEMNTVINPKVLGSMNLHDIFRTTPLDFFILLSSAIGITGNVGQCNYAVANLFMHGLAAQRRKKGLAASVIVIGVILGVGYVTRETSQSLQDNLKKSGHIWMSEQDFHTLFAEAIRDGSAASPYESEIVSGLKSPREDEDHLPPWHINPRFSHLILGSQDSSDAGRTGYEKIPLKLKFLEAQSQESLYEIFRGMWPTILRSYSIHTNTKLEALCDHLVAMLQIDDGIPQSQLLQNTADSLGIDSLNAVDLRSWFMKEAKVDIPVLRILGNSTIGDLLDFAFDVLPVEVAPVKSPDFKPAPAATSKMKPVQIAPKDRFSKPGAKPSSPMGPKVLQAASKPVIAKADLVTPGHVPPRSFPEVSDTKKDMPEPGSSSQSDTGSGNSFSIVNDVSTPSSISEKSSNVSPKDEPTSVQIQRSEKLSHGQSRFWFLQSYVRDPTAFNITCLFQLQGNLDVAKLERAVSQVSHRHEALRTAISDHPDGTPQQHVLQHSGLELEKGVWVNPHDVTTSYEALKNHAYDLSRGKSFRILLLSPTGKSANAHYLIMGYHHINMDGFSLEIILRELEALYVGRRLQNQPFQYADHAASEHRKRSNGGWDSQLQYWRLTLKAPPNTFPILPFADAGTRRTMRTYSHVKSSSTVSIETRRLIQKACKMYKVSPYHFYLAAYMVLLGRWANVSDICIGSSYAGRNDSHLQTSVGLYLNLTPLRLAYDPKDEFSSAMEKTRRLTQEAAVNSEIPFDVLLEELKIKRNSAHSPLFQTFINYRPAADERRPFGNCTLEGKKYEVGKTPYDIMLDVFDGVQSEPTRVELILQQHLYSQGAANMLAQSYEELIATFAKNPQQELGDAPLFSPAELQRSAKIGSGVLTPLVARHVRL